MKKTALVDTNILIYTFDINNPDKQRRALKVLETLRSTKAGYLSVKTLGEFFVVIRRMKDSLTLDELVFEISKFIELWPVLPLTPEIVLEAAHGVRNHQFSYWDAQIWATAKHNGLTAVFTENMGTGSIIDGVAILNPLVPEFDLTDWLSEQPEGH